MAEQWRQWRGCVVSTWLRERKADLMRNLYFAHRLLASYAGDANGRADLQRRVRRATEEFYELHGKAEEFAEYASKQDAEAERAKQLARERAYQQRGICV